MSKNNEENIITRYKALKGKEKRKHEKRHGAVEEYLDEYYNHSNDLSVRIKKGTLHIVGEAFYKLNCLKYLKKDTPKKYVLRNRQIIGVVLAGTLVISGISLSKHQDKPEPEPTPVAPLEDYTFNKMYEVQRGDTLLEVAEDFDVKSSDIRYANSSLFEGSTLLHEGDVLKIPYTVCTDDLGKFTDIIDIGDLSVQEVADIYGTDCKTLQLINGDNITFDYEDREYEINQDQIVVPEFDEIVKKHK